VTPPKSAATLHVIEGGLSPNYVAEAARAHETSGFDLVLVGYSSSSAEGFLVALHAAARTERLGYLIAHRPGFVAPTLMARKIATFDHLSGGRLAVHIITGKTDDEQEGDGDFTPKAERYRRAAEYLELMKLTWASERPFDFAGEFYRVTGARSDVRPLQKPHPPLFFGGASDGALAMGARLCDVYAIYAEPLASTRERIKQFRAQADAFGRTPGFNVSARPIIAASEGVAWDKANKILAGNTSCLVGTPEQVARAILEYYKLGIGSVLIRGFDPFNDTVEFGRELIPRIKAGALEIDRLQAVDDQTRSGQFA
jgi:alkanesulfonate monooxygenase